MGCRSEDIHRLDDAQAVVKALRGRWVMVTLTVDRSKWLDPQSAYERCNERVRRVAAAVAGEDVEAPTWFCGFEVQQKTGDGWPHWHVMVFVPDAKRTVEQIRADVRRAWVTRTESIDTDTGEVTSSVESIGFEHACEASCRVSLGTYVAKYVCKRWDAVPEWMGESVRRHRKFRASPGFYSALERLHRHQVRRGRRPEVKGVRLVRRTLFERMAASGTRANVFRVERGSVVFAGVVPVVFDHEGLSRCVTRYGAEFVRLGRYVSMRLSLDAEGMRRLRRDEATLAKRVDEVRARRLREVRDGWALMQDAIRMQDAERDGGYLRGHYMADRPLAHMA